jgi:hypothetical protein
MVTLLSALVALLIQRNSRVLHIAEAALPESQFKAIRHLLLCEFSQEGLEGELARLLGEREEGTDRADRHEQRRCPVSERTRTPSCD